MGLRDIDPLLSMQLSYWVYGLLLLLVFALGAVIFLGRFFLNRGLKRPNDVFLDGAKPGCFRKDAMATLLAIQSMSIGSHDAEKVYYLALTDCVKQFLSAHFAMALLDLTSPEILLALRSRLDTASMADLTALLADADSVKFAKIRLAKDRHAWHWAKVRDLFDTLNPDDLEGGDLNAL